MTDTDIDATRASALALAPDLEGLTVAVTGGNGFVGARVCTLLAAAGADVRAIVRRAGTAPSGGSIEEVVTTMDGDGDLTRGFDGCDVVVHTAATAVADLDAARAVNVDGTRHVLDAVRRTGVGRVVHVSTVGVHDVDDDDPVLTEDSPLVGEDDSPYAVTKREAEEVVARFDDLDVVVLRPPAILGWSPSSTWGQRIPAWVAAGELPMEPDPRGGWSWVHVDDFAAAIALAAVGDRAGGRTYMVSSGDSDWGTYLGEVHSWFPDAPSPFVEADEPPPGRQVSARRAEDELGWTPTVDLDTALAEIAAHHRD